MPPRRILSALSLLLAALQPALAAAQHAHPTDDSVLISTESLASRLADTSITIIQIERTAELWATGHIPGAQPLLLSAITTTRGHLSAELPSIAVLDSVLEAAGVSNGRRIIIYGDPLAAGRLFFTLDYLGLGRHAAILDGGFSKWKAEGRQVTTDTTPAPRGRIQPDMQPGTMADAGWVRQHLDDSMTVILDARPTAEYHGEVPGEAIERPGHIPGAMNFPWRESFSRQDPSTLLTRPELQEILGRAGLTPARQVVIYCRTGTQASWLYFVARYLGYSPRLYDASYPEWSADPSLPVEGPPR
ncbi:MAG: rhodanese-like domain-containing protein [Gemmatimonadota bacterium]|nr:rhodanese-like domain-containing protein [Gemmatimonadota bacterium]MDH5282946.1 rhodanese-like domain-containing protein [Gemmatimonadota bacterium]